MRLRDLFPEYHHDTFGGNWIAKKNEKKIGTFGLHPLQPIFYQHSPALTHFYKKKWSLDQRLHPLNNELIFSKRKIFMSHNFLKPLFRFL